MHNTKYRSELKKTKASKSLWNKDDYRREALISDDDDDDGGGEGKEEKEGWWANDMKPLYRNRFQLAQIQVMKTKAEPKSNLYESLLFFFFF